MSTADSLGVLRTRFDQRPDGTLPLPSAVPEAHPPRSRARDVVGPIQIVPAPDVAPTLPPSDAEAAELRREGLLAARGALFGILLGSTSWVVIGGVLYWMLG